MLLALLAPSCSWSFPKQRRLPLTTTTRIEVAALLLSSLRGGDDSDPLLGGDASCTFPHGQPPYLAVITEPNACESEEALQRTVDALSRAVSCSSTDNNGVDLISLRHSVPTNPAERRGVANRLVRLAQELVDLSCRFPFRVVISSDWIDIVPRVPGLHGIHVKESHRDQIPAFRQAFGALLLIGTSAHSVASAVDAWQRYQPDYFFVGTCYITQTHPEKSVQDLEGPALPGQVVAALQEMIGSDTKNRPPVLAIGGINGQNCQEPVRVFGADGAATIRAVLQAPDPALEVQKMKQNMKQ